MLRRVYKQTGFVLMVTLIFIFVMTFIIITGSENMILQYKMQSNMLNEMRVFAYAEFGLQKMIFTLQHKSLFLPSSSISLITSKKIISIDSCGNKTIDLHAVASNALSTVILNSRAIFAKVPPEVHCKILPAYRCVWWKKE